MSGSLDSSLHGFKVSFTDGPCGVCGRVLVISHKIYACLIDQRVMVIVSNGRTLHPTHKVC